MYDSFMCVVMFDSQLFPFPIVLSHVIFPMSFVPDSPPLVFLTMYVRFLSSLRPF